MTTYPSVADSTSTALWEGRSDADMPFATCATVSDTLAANLFCSALSSLCLVSESYISNASECCMENNTQAGIALHGPCRTRATIIKRTVRVQHTLLSNIGRNDLHWHSGSQLRTYKTKCYTYCGVELETSPNFCFAATCRSEMQILHFTQKHWL